MPYHNYLHYPHPPVSRQVPIVPKKQKVLQIALTHPVLSLRSAGWRRSNLKHSLLNNLVHELITITQKIRENPSNPFHLRSYRSQKTKGLANSINTPGIVIAIRRLADKQSQT
jgi:hypothetical protein